MGRSARSNDDVTFSHANPSDLWFHAFRMPGSHVVLKTQPGTDPTDEESHRAASLAAHFSKAKNASKAEVMMTEKKNVTKIKGGPPGLVRVKSYKTIRVTPKPPEETDR